VVADAPLVEVDRARKSCGRMEQWAEIRRLYLVKRLSVEEIVRRTCHARKTVRRRTPRRS
jgi:hypothetical protein